MLKSSIITLAVALSLAAQAATAGIAGIELMPNLHFPTPKAQVSQEAQKLHVLPVAKTSKAKTKTDR